MTGVQMRVEMAKELRGTGVEFGAGTNPFPAPAHCNVIYADRNSSEELAARDYFAGQGTVPSRIQTDIAEMEGVAESSVDFIIGSHVIEHTPNPIKALGTHTGISGPAAGCCWWCPTKTSRSTRGVD